MTASSAEARAAVGEEVRLTTFGPSALATPANALTLGRLLASPVMLVLIVATGPSSWLLASLWLVLSASDGFDGFVARRMGATRSGAFLDPLADKFLVLFALAGLAAVREVGWLPFALIAAREVAMSVFRSYAGRQGVSIPARPAAKVKTLLQDVAVGLALMPVIGAGHAWIARDVLWIAVVLTLFSGIEYALEGRRLVASGGGS